MADNEYQSSELSELTGIDENILVRFLEDKKMFPPKRVDESNGITYYDESIVNRLNAFKPIDNKAIRPDKTDKEYQPGELSKLTGINKSTLNRYLEDSEMLPPIRTDANNNYRYYDESTVDRLNLFKALGKKPFRLKKKEIKEIFQRDDFNEIMDQFKKSKKALRMRLIEKDVI